MLRPFVARRLGTPPLPVGQFLPQTARAR